MPEFVLNGQLRKQFPNAFWRGNQKRREIALTFDDGPGAKSTPELLSLLDHFGVKATFFHIGQRAYMSGRLVKNVADAGHQIGLHGYLHESFLLKGSTVLQEELALAQRVIADDTGLSPAHFNAVRPPYGHFTPTILKNLNEWGYQPVMWGVVPFHWLQNATSTIRQVIKSVGNGTIVVLHENLPGPPVAELTASILPLLMAEGYHFVTINEMLSRQ
jgi:peptidoglycan/xylan/chitin deacetylase (PgdA/CDA1 family)